MVELRPVGPAIASESGVSFMSALSWMWRIRLCLMLAIFLAGMVAAQISPRVQVTIEPTPSRGDTAWFDLQLQIPGGYFVPAETRGALKGAWLQPLPPGLPGSFRRTRFPVRLHCPVQIAPYSRIPALLLFACPWIH
jgi:hypothetical protein